MALSLIGLSMSSQLKKQLRKEMRSLLNSLSTETVLEQSTLQQSIVMSMPCYKDSMAMCIYLPMPKELQTYDVIKNAFSNGKRIFVPKIIGPNPQDMVMIEVLSFEQLDSFPKSKWGIPEPPVEMAHDGDKDALYDIDLVLLPGVAFDSKCNRLGHGKGYYDCFLERLIKTKTENQLRIPKLVGLSLLEQIIEGPIPMEDHDTPLDFIVSPQEIYASS